MGHNRLGHGQNPETMDGIVPSRMEIYGRVLIGYGLDNQREANE